MTWRDVQQVSALVLCVAGLMVTAVKIGRKPATWRTWVPLVIALAINTLYYVAVIIDVLGGLANELSPTRSLVTIAMLFIYSLLMPVLSHDH